MAKYRKKPVVIEAIQWTGDNLEEIINFIGYEPVFQSGYATKEKFIIIKTLEGQHIASQCDYIIKGVVGEFYPCKSDIFEKTYEQVEE